MSISVCALARTRFGVWGRIRSRLISCRTRGRATVTTASARRGKAATHRFVSRVVGVVEELRLAWGAGRRVAEDVSARLPCTSGHGRRVQYTSTFSVSLSRCRSSLCCCCCWRVLRTVCRPSPSMRSVSASVLGRFPRRSGGRWAHEGVAPGTRAARSRRPAAGCLASVHATASLSASCNRAAPARSAGWINSARDAIALPMVSISRAISAATAFASSAFSMR